MPRKKKIEPVNPLIAVAEKMIKSKKRSFDTGYDVIKINTLELQEDKTYKCLITVNNSKIVIGHAKPAKNEMEAVMFALEHAQLMGNHIIDTETNED